MIQNMLTFEYRGRPCRLFQRDGLWLATYLHHPKAIAYNENLEPVSTHVEAIANLKQYIDAFADGAILHSMLIAAGDDYSEASRHVYGEEPDSHLSFRLKGLPLLSKRSRGDR